MARLIFLNRFFFPDQSATSQMLSDLAFALAQAGHDVHVVTSRQLYDNPKAELPAQENIRGVAVHRVRSTRFGRASLAGRAIDYITIYMFMTLKVAGLARAGDVAIAKTDPPLISVLAMLPVRLRGAKLVNWLQDIYPEIATEIGVPLSGGLGGRILARLRNASLSLAAANVVVGEKMADRLRATGIAPEKISTIANWCDDEDIVPIPNDDNPLRIAWGLRDKFVIGYSGNLGRGHDFATMLSASERFKGDPRIRFAVIGGGHRFDAFQKQVEAKGMQSIYLFLPYQKRADLKYSLSAFDVHWLSLQSRVADLMFPSKFYGIAAAGRPMIALTGREGEIAELVRAYECGFAIGQDDVEGTADAIAYLSQNSGASQKMGSNARGMLDARFGRRQALERWDKLLNDVIAMSPT